jgi:hypothetical protein
MLRKIPVAVRKGSGNTPGKGEFDLRAQARKVCSHKFSGDKKEAYNLRFLFAYGKFSTNLSRLSTSLIWSHLHSPYRRGKIPQWHID